VVAGVTRGQGRGRGVGTGGKEARIHHGERGEPRRFTEKGKWRFAREWIASLCVALKILTSQ